MNTQTEDNARARSQGQAQYESIKEMVRALERYANDDERREDAERTIHEDALSVEVRSAWRSTWETWRWDAQARRTQIDEPSEYRILLCTGGPAVQIIGKLNDFSEPETARLQVQDWFTPWTDFTPDDPEDNAGPEEIMLVYSRQFYFGES